MARGEKSRWHCVGRIGHPLQRPPWPPAILMRQEMNKPECYMCRRPLTENDKDRRIYELEDRLHRIDVSFKQYIDGLVTVAELAGIFRAQRDDIAGENHEASGGIHPLSNAV